MSFIFPLIHPQLNHKLIEGQHPWTDYMKIRLDTTHDSTLYHHQLLKMMQKNLNFNVRVRKTDTWSASVGIENITGELGFLYRHQAVFMITPYRLTSDRLSYGDITAITWQPQFLFLFRHPKSTSISSKYLVPFQSSVWLVILILLLAFILILAVHLQRSRTFETVSDRSLFGVTLWLAGYFCQQYATHLPNLNSSRMLVLTLVLMSFLLYQYYCTFIIGSLIVESPKTIKTLKDLVESGLEIGTTRAVYTRDLFYSVADPTMAYIYEEKIEKRKNRMEVEEGVRRIQRGNFAFHHDSEALYGTVVQTFSDHEICDLSTVAFFRPFPTCMQTAKRSAYRELFLLGLQPIIESGIAEMERLKFFTLKPKCDKSQVEVVPVAFDTVTVPMFVIVGGVIASAIVLALELFYHRFSKKWHEYQG